MKKTTQRFGTLKYKGLLAGLMFMTIAPSYAQKGFGLGARAGVNATNLTGVSGDYRIGFHAGLYGDWYFSKRFGLELGVYYS